MARLPRPTHPAPFGWVMGVLEGRRASRSSRSLTIRRGDQNALPPAAAFYIAAMAVAALGSLLSMLPRADPLSWNQAGLALALAGTMTLGGLRPLPFAAGTKLALDTSALIAAILLFDPGVAMLVVGAGKLVSQVLCRKSLDQIAFNVAQMVLLSAAGGLLLASGDWQVEQLQLERPGSVVLPVMVGVVLWLLNALAVAVIIALHRRDSLLDVWFRAVAGDGLAERAASLAQVGLGVLVAAGVQERHGWLALLLVPAGAAYPVLAHHIRQRRRAELALAHQATHDPLTDLPNRVLLLDRLARSLGSPGQRDGLVGVLFLDLDRFKFVNDRLGHEAGDALLVIIADRLRACSRAGDTVARFGGDEFVVLLERLTDRQSAEVVAERVAAALAAPTDLNGYDLTVAASVGIALAQPGEVGPMDLLRDADEALRRAKAHGKARCVVYEPWMGVHLRERVTLEGELRGALERNELRLVYQPVMELSSGRMEGVEVLVRWHHPQRGVVMPEAFVSLAEETGLIGPIGAWVLEAACRQGRVWQEQLARPPIVGVNLSARQFQQTDLIACIDSILRDTGMDANLLRLELTESAVMADVSSAAVTLGQLKDLGVWLALDDFGTGYSSLSSLRHFPIDLLKIDRTFVAGLGRDDGDAAVVQAVVALASALGLGVVAEGVETPEQLGRLRQMRCALGQGYLFAPPLTSAAVTRMLEEGSAVNVHPARRAG